jgi:hypothetical protein
VFVLGNDSNFSLSANDYYGFEKNCIYFRDKDRVIHFNLKDLREWTNEFGAYNIGHTYQNVSNFDMCEQC